CVYPQRTRLIRSADKNSRNRFWYRTQRTDYTSRKHPQESANRVQRSGSVSRSRRRSTQNELRRGTSMRQGMVRKNPQHPVGGTANHRADIYAYETSDEVSGHRLRKRIRSYLFRCFRLPRTTRTLVGRYFSKDVQRFER